MTMTARAIFLLASSATLAAGSAVLACGGSTSDGGASSGASSSGGSTSSSSGSVPPGQSPSCDASGAVNLAVTSDDPNGYPPYAVAECTLVYVNGAGALVIRNLVTNAEKILEDAQAKARRPAISIDVGANGELTPVIAWETIPLATTPGQAPPPSVRVKYGEAEPKTLSGDFVGASEPRVSGYRVAFTAWKGATEKDDMDVWMYDARTSSARMVIGGAGQQRFADISASHVAASDFSEDPDGRYDRDEKDLADIVLFEITTSAIAKRVLPGKQAFPMLTDNNLLAYLSWTGVHPEPKFQAYDLKAGPLSVADPVTADRTIAHVEYVTSEPVRPSVIGSVVEWVDNPNGQTSLNRASVDGSQPPAKVSGLDNLQLYAPSGNRTFTILATIDTRPNNPDRTPRLKTITR
jgi:hypothetical protein